MSTVQCSHCQGTGKVFARLSLTTGEVEYRPCSVCNGTGSVPVEKGYFTEYPDLSLENALALMRAHGRPVEICISANHDIRVLFQDGARYILGGFTVGYRGTGPDYTKRFLDAAGFDVSRDEIAEMEPPVTLVAGQPYIPPKTLVFQAPTLEEARKAAVESVPPDARVLSLEVVCDGATVRTVEAVGVSEEAAYEEAKGRLPEGAVIEGKEVRDETRTFSGQGLTEEDALRGWPLSRDVPKGAGIEEKEVREEVEFYEGEGDTKAAAFRHAKGFLPKGAVIVKRGVLQEGSQGTLTVNALFEREASEKAYSQLPQGAVIESIDCTRGPHIHEGVLPGLLLLLGLVKDKPGTYEVSWQSPWRVQIGIQRIKLRLTIRQKWVTLTYRPQPAIRVRFQPSTKEG